MVEIESCIFTFYLGRPNRYINKYKKIKSYFLFRRPGLKVIFQIFLISVIPIACAIVFLIIVRDLDS
jgi:hypothetical protein